MIIRVQANSGTKRIQCEPTESTSDFMKKVKEAFELGHVSEFNIYTEKNRNDSSLIPLSERKMLCKFHLKHGDMVYMNTKKPVTTEENCVKNGEMSKEESVTKKSKTTLIKSDQTSNSVQTKSKLEEDEVDRLLWKKSGLIERPKDKMCKHGDNAKCVHCTSLEPYDEAYLKECNIKHLSFHAYLRKLTAGVDKGKFAALENISCRIKEGCKSHPPWPNGICTKCQPNTVTLSRQVYRHVDNIVFENGVIVDRFLNYWRTTGHQRVGFLYGYYEQHKDVPLGIRAKVVAIYEPPQESTRDVVKLDLPENNLEILNCISNGLGIQRIGWIFTDLISDNIQKGSVKNLRNINTYFLSAQECIMAGYFQTNHPNACRISPEGYFGSKFVTVVVSGNKDNQIQMEGYQVSNQCMALSRDDCLVPTKDAPELAYVRETSKAQYVPDVFFKEKDGFGNDVTKIARLLPVEYLLVDVPVSTPVEPQFTFNSLIKKQPFPIENRMVEDSIQNFPAVIKYMGQFTKDNYLEAMSDFHYLLYLSTMEMLPMKDSLEPLLEAIKTKDRKKAEDWSKNEHWSTVEQLIAHSYDNESPGTSTPSNAREIQASEARWSCKYCTFENGLTSSSCEICGLPK